MNPGRLLPAAHSAAFLAAGGGLAREIRSPEKPRPPEFRERYESRALVYDCFWHADGRRILLVGPPPMNLKPALAAARYVAQPSGQALKARYFPSLSTMITELSGAPAGTTALQMEVGGQQFELPVQPNHSEVFAGKRMLFAMSRNNELAWIREWAEWHARLHGTNALVFFDNGSTLYAAEEIEETLLGIDQLDHVTVHRWPYAFGMTDHALAINPYWSHFLQISSMSVVLRRYGAKAFGLLNCDPDELAATHSGRAIYDLLAEARRGLVVFRGQWIEAVAQPGVMPRRHREFVRRLKDPRAATSRPGKWVIDPKRDWFERLDAHPYWHWLAGRPWFGKSMPKDAFYRHFKGINTNWKEGRTAPPAGDTEIDTALVGDFARAGMT